MLKAGMMTAIRKTGLHYQEPGDQCPLAGLHLGGEDPLNRRPVLHRRRCGTDRRCPPARGGGGGGGGGAPAPPAPPPPPPPHRGRGRSTLYSLLPALYFRR